MRASARERHGEKELEIGVAPRPSQSIHCSSFWKNLSLESLTGIHGFSRCIWGILLCFVLVTGFLTSPGKPFIRDRMKFLLLFEEASSWNCWILLEREAQMTLDWTPWRHLEAWGDHFKVEEDSEINAKGNGSWVLFMLGGWRTSQLMEILKMSPACCTCVWIEPVTLYGYRDFEDEPCMLHMCLEWACDTVGICCLWVLDCRKVDKEESKQWLRIKDGTALWRSFQLLWQSHV